MLKKIPGRGAGVPVDKRLAALRRFAISISAFTIVGHLWLGFETPWAAVVVALLTSYVLEIGLEALDARVAGRPPRFGGSLLDLVYFLLPGHIGALAIAMLLYPGGQLWPFVFAVTVATCGKHLIKAPVDGRMRHVVNPSNLGISATLLLFPWVGVGLPYQFTETTTGVVDIIIPLALFASGLLLNWRLTGRMPLVVAWVAFFALQAVLRGLSPDVSVVGALAPMTGLAFLLFTTYMITDPGTTPSEPRAQVTFAAACAGVYAIFMLAHVVYGLFYCVTIVCLARAALLWARAWLDSRAETRSVVTVHA